MNPEDQKQEEPPLDAVLSEEQFQALIHGARAGLPAAFGALLDACRRYLLAIAREAIPTALQSKLDPLDLLQDTALDAQRGFAMFEGNSRAELFAWLRRVLLNNAANERRRYEKVAKRSVRREVSLESLINELEERYQTVGDPLVAAERWARLEVGLNRLPSDLKRVIVLRHHEHQSFAEIGRELKRTAGAARKLWARAIRRLQQELRQGNPDT